MKRGYRRSSLPELPVEPGSHTGGELRECAGSVDSSVDSTFPDLGVNTRDLCAFAAIAAWLCCFLTLAGMTAALFSDWLTEIPISCRVHRYQKFSFRLVRRSWFMSFNTSLHLRAEFSRLVTISGICCIMELYCWYVTGLSWRFLGTILVYGLLGLCSFLPVSPKRTLLSRFLLHFTFIADDEGTEANISLPLFVSANAFLLAAVAGRVFATWSFEVLSGDTLLFPVVVITLFPVCRSSYISSAQASQVLIVAVVSELSAAATIIHGGLAVSLLERISSVPALDG